jgi:alcohol dehydrogenase class IV
MGFLTSPRIAFGVGALEQLSALDLHRVALFMDPAVAGGTRVHRIREEIGKTDARVEEFTGIRIEPTLESVQQAAAWMTSTSPDFVVAVGGGSTLDTAKGAWVRYERPDLSLPEVTPLTELGLRRKARFVAIPTTAGSGSEACGLAHFHRPGAAMLEIGSRELEPDWALLDPNLLTTLSPGQMAAEGVDALAHALEAIASEWANPFTDALARDATALLVRELPGAVKRPGDLELLGRVQAAATMAGLATGNAHAGAAHALAHALGAAFELPHAPTVAALLPHVVAFNFPSARDRYATLGSTLGAGAVQNRNAMAERLRLFIEQVGGPLTLVQAGLEMRRLADERSRVLDYAIASPSVVGNPRLPSREELGQVLDAAASGSPVQH